MTNITTGKALYATFPNINTPNNLDGFDGFLGDGLSRLNVFAFAPTSADSLPINTDWYTSDGGQLQGLNTAGRSTATDWANFFAQFTAQNVQVGFVFGGANQIEYLGDMIQGLLQNDTDFQDFLATLSYYNVTFIEFDIESSWTALSNSFGKTFQDNFQKFAENMAANGIPVAVGASSPIGTINGAPSGAPDFLDQDFVEQNAVYFNVYTYAAYEYANVVTGTDWLPTDTNGIGADYIMFTISSYSSASNPPTSGYIDYGSFYNDWPTCPLLSAIDSGGYKGVVVWVWWEGVSDYTNVQALFTSFELGIYT